LYGLHQPKFLTPFEIACWAILGQRQPWRVAHRTKMALVERWGTSITLPSGTYRAFPEPQQLAAVATSDLAAVVRNERKVDYLRAVIQFFMEIDEQFLRGGDYEEVAAQVRGIRGIGVWSSHFILVRGLGRMERVSTVDQELARAAADIYNNGQPLASAELQRIFDRYGPAQGYWALYARIATPAHTPFDRP
jgi:DNA-3-methyladenine glycosylase II